jgi:steroid 5-alpha reductase family enzyme
MSLFEIIGLSLAAVVTYVTAIWLVSLALRNASIVDVFWGPGFALLAALYLVTSDGFVGRRILVTTLVSVWGLRLALYVLWRNWGKGWRPSSTGRPMS